MILSVILLTWTDPMKAPQVLMPRWRCQSYIEAAWLLNSLTWILTCLLGFWLISGLLCPLKTQKSSVLSASNRRWWVCISPDEKYLFCPALIRLEVDTKVFKHRDDLAYYFGWVMSCSHKDQFLDTRFLHVFLLRISLSLGLAPIIDSDVPFLQRTCMLGLEDWCLLGHGWWYRSVGWGHWQEESGCFDSSSPSHWIFLSCALLWWRKLLTLPLSYALYCSHWGGPPSSSQCDLYPLENTHVFDLKSLAESVINQKMCVVSTNNVLTYSY